MGNVMCLYLVLAGILYLTQAQSFHLRKEFINGNLKFTWTNVSTHRKDIIITVDGRTSAWIRTTDHAYTIKDVWKYKSVKILVREIRTRSNFTDYKSTYTVSRIDVHEGESKNLTWTAEDLPTNGEYNIYHFHDDTRETVMQVMKKGATTSKPLKYVYHTRPYNSPNIILEVKTIGVMDGGYYGGGSSEIDARGGPGVVLVVIGKPTKPQIKGTMKKTESSDVILTCSSNTTSRPSYYSKTISLTYIWYRNNTVMDSETRMELRFPKISRDERFNSYSCQSKESIESEKSDEVQISVMYLSKPVWTVNGNMQEKVNIPEGEDLILSCSVDGKPTPILNISRRSQKGILKTKQSEVMYQKRAQCDDTDIYNCTAKSTGFNNKHAEVTINVICDIRIDTEGGFKANYDSRSGPNVKVFVKVPIISNPTPSVNLITWSGPTSNIRNEIKTDIKERGDIYKHWINSSIPVNDKNYFGNYTMKYNGETIFTITINAKDRPSPPLRFTGYSYSSGYINLTWISDFNGGLEQFFILSRKDESNWIEVANITDPGEGHMGYYDPGLLNQGREYWYQLDSCNRINCSSRPVQIKVTVLECNSRYFISGKNPNEHYRNSSDCLPCGNCKDNLPCNTTSGHCSEGCQINFQPPYCTELITPDQSNTPQTSTIVLAIICTVLLVTIAIIAGVAFRRILKRRSESTPSQSENEANTPMNATEGQQQPEDTYDYPLNEYEKINVATNDHTYTTPEQQQSEDTYECPLNEYEDIKGATDGHTYDNVA